MKKNNKKNTNKKNNKIKDKELEIKGFFWVHVAGIVVVVAGVMGYGLIGEFIFGYDNSSALSMLAMIPIMSIAYLLIMRPIIRSIRQRMYVLAKAMEDVAEGDLSCQIDLEGTREYRELYKHFNIMASELKKSREEMENFTNEFAHEFKTPITAISGFADVLLESENEISREERREYLELISDESKRLLRLSQNTLLLSKVEAMQIVIEKVDYDLAEQIRKCLILLSKSIENKNIEIEMDEDLKLPYYGNQEIMQHVWINLLNNAIKFTPENGKITINGSAKNTITVSIADTGIGMDEATIEKIFDKFYQNDPVSLTKGSGIGLSIVKRIVTLCDGNITVISHPGKGSKFTIDLPNVKRK